MLTSFFICLLSNQKALDVKFLSNFKNMDKKDILTYIQNICIMQKNIRRYWQHSRIVKVNICVR